MKTLLNVIAPAHFNYRFPRDKRLIAQLTTEQKGEWYAHQFKRDPGVYPVELTSAEFLHFWRWKYYFPLRVKRFFYRIKNFEIFKRYDHITVMKDKVRKHAI